MRMAAAVIKEKALSEQLENICWNDSSSKEGDLRLNEWESEKTDLNEKCYREDFLQENKFESKKSIWDEKVCSMCEAWQDKSDGFRFHLPEDIFAARPPSLNVEKSEKWGSSNIEEEEREKIFCEEEKEKNFCEEEKEVENEELEGAVEGKNQVTCWVFFFNF